MSYYKTWMELSEDNSNQQAYIEYVKRYYAMEKNAYEIILSAYPDNQSFLEGKAKDMALKLGFTDDTMDIFVGFLDGIKSSLTNADDLDLEAVVDDTDIKLSLQMRRWLRSPESIVMPTSLIPIRSAETIPALAVQERSIRIAAVKEADKLGGVSCFEEDLNGKMVHSCCDITSVDRRSSSKPYSRQSSRIP